MGTPPPAPPKEKAPPTPATPTANEDVRLLQEADALARRGEIDPALFRYERLPELFPDSPLAPEAMVRAAQILLARNQQDKALALLKKAAARTPHPFAARAATLLNELMASQGGADQAWRYWGERLGAESPASLQGAHTWRQLLESYFQTATAENTPPFLAILPPGGLSPEQGRILFQMAARLPEERLKEVLALHPPTSPVAPHLHIALGDARAQAGVEEEALQHWNSALSGDSLASGEAKARLHPEEVGPPVLVGLLLPMSGRYETLGENLLYAAKFALGAFRDTPIQLRVEETGGTAEGARQGMTRLAAEGVQAVIGPVFHEEAAAAAEVALSADIPILTLNPNQDIAALDPRKEGKRRVFLNAFQPDRQARAMARYAVQNAERRRFAILAPESEYGKLTAESFRQEALRLGAQVGETILFTPEATDLSPWLKKLAHVDGEASQRRKSAQSSARPLDPSETRSATKEGELEPWAEFDALFLPVRTEQARLAAPQLALYNMRHPSVLLLGTALWNRPELLKEGTDYLQGAVFCDAEAWPAKQYEANFSRVWGKPPSSVAMLLHDGIAALAQLLREQRMQGAAWRDGFTRPEGFMGASGRFQFLEDGSGERLLHYYHVEANGVVSRSPQQEPVPPPPLALIPATGAPAP